MIWNGKQTLNVTAAILAAGLLLPSPAAAQGVNQQFQIPDGCNGFLTVQSRSCTVSHYWTCEADPAGTHWRVALDEEGAYYLSFVDAEFRWLRSFNLRRGNNDTLIEPENDPASLSELLETGSDTMVFSIQEESAQGTFQRDYTGYDRLTGGVISIDGIELEITEFAYQWETGNGPRETEGNQFVSRDLRLFFGGVETVTLPSGDTVEVDYSPVEFAQPGEAGYLATQPLYDCGDMMSGWPNQGDAG